jgi:hypothetical protein
MNPRAWLSLGLILACGLLIATAGAAHSQEQSPPKLLANHNAPLAERAFHVGQDLSPVVFSEYDSDSRGVHPALNCCSHIVDLHAAVDSPISGGLRAYSGAPSLVSQGVRLQI